MAHVIAVANQKGGVGKTTTAINLGAALAEQGRYTLLCDLDPQGGLSLGLGLAAHDLDLTIYNILTDARIPIAGLVHHIRPHLDLLPSNIDLAVAEVQLISALGREYILRDALAPVRDRYDYVLLDCPPSLGLLTVNALTAADAVLVPLQVEYFALRGVESLMDVVARVRRRLNPHLEILGLLPTMVDIRRLHDQSVIRQVRQAYPQHMMDLYIKESVKFSDAPAQQRSILEYDTRHDGARAYRELARLTLRYWGELPPEPAPPVESAPAASASAAPAGNAPEANVVAVPVDSAAEPGVAAAPTETSQEPSAEAAPVESTPEASVAAVPIDSAAEPNVEPELAENAAELNVAAAPVESAPEASVAAEPNLEAEPAGNAPETAAAGGLGASEPEADTVDSTVAANGRPSEAEAPTPTPVEADGQKELVV